MSFLNDTGHATFAYSSSGLTSEVYNSTNVLHCETDSAALKQDICIWPIWSQWAVQLNIQMILNDSCTYTARPSRVRANFSLTVRRSALYPSPSYKTINSSQDFRVWRVDWYRVPTSAYAVYWQRATQLIIIPPSYQHLLTPPSFQSLAKTLYLFIYFRWKCIKYETIYWNSSYNTSLRLPVSYATVPKRISLTVLLALKV